MSQFASEAGTQVWGYCLRSNLVHLVMVPSEDDGLRAALGEAHSRYTHDMNFRQSRRVHLWQERLHSFVMDEQYLLATVRYVERNAVVARPGDWKCSTAFAHLLAQDDKLVQVKPMLDREDCHWAAYLSAQYD